MRLEFGRQLIEAVDPDLQYHVVSQPQSGNKFGLMPVRDQGNDWQIPYVLLSRC